ncbi:hypothetical protein PIB30_104244 [Stylosanthes scabra]|uniref:Uncharacterized protein n=1 Tax=Stylosanthes scabra TaxID=79078 RepID=A0ABU6WZY1_9FABA|nr:hypothetical protein [Stylosanthes scabra]
MANLSTNLGITRVRTRVFLWNLDQTKAMMVPPVTSHIASDRDVFAEDVARLSMPMQVVLETKRMRQQLHHGPGGEIDTSSLHKTLPLFTTVMANKLCRSDSSQPLLSSPSML